MSITDGVPSSPLNPTAPVEVQYACQEIGRGTRALKAAVDRFPPQSMSDDNRRRLQHLLETQAAVLRGVTEVAEAWKPGA